MVEVSLSVRSRRAPTITPYSQQIRYSSCYPICFKHSDVDISIANQRQDDDLMIGTSLREYLRESEDKLLGTTDLANFYKHVRAILSTSTIKKLPFDDTVINDIAYLP